MAMFVPDGALVSTASLNIIREVVDFWICSALCLTGEVTNVLVLMTFSKQGLNDRTTISLTAIAILDFVVCLCGLVTRMDYFIQSSDAVLALNYRITSDSYVATASLIMAIASGVLAAYVAIERCICVMFPFKIKAILTPKVTLFTVCGICIVVFGSQCVIYSWFQLSWTYMPGLNASILLFTLRNPIGSYEESAASFVSAYSFISGFWPVSSFTVMVFCTVLIVYKLKRGVLTRNSLNQSVKIHQDQREVKVTRMLLVIIAIYIAAIIPRLGSYGLRIFMQGFGEYGKYQNFHNVYTIFVNVSNFINASINFFIYLKMSSSFRKTYMTNVSKLFQSSGT